MPKMIINGANDPYWTVDALNFYWDDLKGDKWVLIVPNAGHNLEERKLDGKRDRERALNALAAFVRHVVKDNPMPKLEWKHEDAGDQLRLTVKSTPAPKDARVFLTKSGTRDFRRADWKEQLVKLREGTVIAELDRPAKGFIAFYAEMDYEIDGLRHQLSTQVRVVEASEGKPQGRTDAGWKDLFDGKTLEGWKPADYFKPGKVQVKDGAIVMEKGTLMTGVVYKKGDFPKMDYEVTLEGKKIDGEDFFCTTTFPVGDSFCSLVVGGWSGTVVGLSSLDSMDAGSNDTRKDMSFKTGQWYKVRFRVSKNRIEAWIDKEKMVDVDTTGKRISIRSECNECKPFGIATYETTGAIRNIQVRPLTEADRKAIAATKPEK
jgi:hypothetical protein